MLSGLKRIIGLGVALAASGVLLIVPPAPLRRPDQVVPAALAWPNAQKSVTTATLPDGTAFQPGIFLDAGTSIGDAPTRDGRFTRLVLRRADAPVRELRRLPAAETPSFPAFAASGTVVVWMEGTRGAQLALWAADPRAGGPPRRLTTDTGDARFYRSDTDLVIADGQVHWTAYADGDVTQIRSIPLTGGTVTVRAEPGRWRLTTWPWLVNGVTDASGATLLRNLATGRDQPVARQAKGATDCGPSWCRVARLTGDGTTRIDLVHPDGGARRRIGGADTATAITDVALLNRFEVISRIDSNAELTGHEAILVHEIATRRTVLVSPDATDVTYRNGILWWSTGNRDSFVRHALDLRTV